MFSAELKVNGSIVATVYGTKIGPLDSSPDDRFKYAWEYWEPLKTVQKGEVVHSRKEGLTKLVQSILELVDK